MPTRTQRRRVMPVPLRLRGKTVAFAGKFGYRDTWLDRYRTCVAAEGGTVVDIELATPDYLVAGQGRGGNPPAIVARVQKQHPGVQVLEEADFCRLLVPTRDELIAEILHGVRSDNRWDQLEEICQKGAVTIDLSGADLRKTNLNGAKLTVANLDGADLRDISAQYAHFGTLNAVKFDGAELSHAYLMGAEDCSFRGANMTEVWLYSTHAWGRATHYPRCDFSGAKLTKARGRLTHAIESVFRDADLSEAELEQSNLERADFSGANLSQTHFHKANLTNAKLTRAKLHRADLRDVSLVNADLSRCDLREAVLVGADLTGAMIDGADFTGANLAGAKIAGLDASKAKNFQPRPPRAAGPNMRELAKVAAASKLLSTSVELEISKDERVVLSAAGRVVYQNKFYADASSRFVRGQEKYGDNERHDAATFEQGMLNAAERWSIGKLRLDTVTAKGSKCPKRGAPLLELATAAWCEAFGIDVSSPDTIRSKKEEHLAERESLQATMLAELRGGAAGVKKWNARPPKEREKIGRLRRVDFAGAKLAKVLLEDRDLQGCIFDGATLRKANFEFCQLEKASFAKADLSGASLRSTKCSNASFEGAFLTKANLSGSILGNVNFRDADLTHAELHFSDLRGADLSTAKLDGADFRNNSFDEKTRLPAKFTLPEGLIWNGTGPDPRLARAVKARKRSGPLDFDAFMQLLPQHVEAAKLDKALQMLKADRFKLFAQVADDALTGVVKSQTDPDLVYSCKLAAHGSFGCCTQNLNVCGGLRGTLCKHLLVLIIGLAKAGELDARDVDAWVQNSRLQKPVLDRDAMSETFLRYKGAEAGEVDWRPTETIPEDYYAL